MRIIYIGNFRYSWCSEVHFTRELESLGHTVIRIQEPPGGGNLGTVHYVEQVAKNEFIDLVMWTRTWGMPPEETTALWRRLEEHGIKTASYHLDLYVGLKREGNVLGDPFWTTGHVFTPDGDPTSQAWFESHGINHHYSAPAVVSDETNPGVYRCELAHDVVFVGSPASAYHPEFPHRGQLLSFLKRAYGRRFHRYGPGAERMRGQDLNDLYASARVVVGDSLAMDGHSWYWSDRAYETVGRGGFLIHPRIEGLETHFTDGEHLRFYDYGEFAALKQLIDEYLANPEEARRIAHRGQAHVREHHTYKHRFAAALEVITSS